MKKGISTVIATIIMLVITVALAGVAYMYMSGALVNRAAKMISLVDASCGNTGVFYMTVKNMDPYTSVGTDEIIVRQDGTPLACAGWTLISGGACTTIPKNGGSCICASAAGAGTSGTAYRIRVVGPVNAEEREAFC
ncbi:MAG TPA: archaellin/type IV pilin N-terminal domain-containing protein [archaeon]|nr:archaellin/type IV pilin N-terminal domain-containing protein [archaeon]